MQRDTATRFLFTASASSSLLSGAAYQFGACDFKRSIAWVKSASPYVLAHELEHVLGAPHDNKGVMSPVLQSDKDLTLFQNSIASIERFITRDPRSWCLKRNQVNTKTLGVQPQWT